MATAFMDRLGAKMPECAEEMKEKQADSNACGGAGKPWKDMVSGFMEKLGVKLPEGTEEIIDKIQADFKA